MLIDSHCHLFDTRYKKTPSQLFDECREEGVMGLINIGTHLSSCRDNLNKIMEIDGVYTSIGIFPHEDAEEKTEILIKGLRSLLNEDFGKKIIAIGECGVDIGGWEKARNLEDQIILFDAQINLAIEFNLPVIIHNRNGDEHILKLMDKYKNLPFRGVVHGTPADRTWEVCKKFLNRGYYISFGGNITYPSNNQLREIVKKVPDDMFLLETDSPYLPPQGHRGEINQPKYVRIVAEKAAQIKEKSFEEVSRLSFDNTCRLFGI